MAWIASKDSEHESPLVRLHVICGFASAEAADECIDDIVDTLSNDDLLDVFDLEPVGHDGHGSFEEGDPESCEGEVDVIILAKLWRSSLNAETHDVSKHFRDDEAHVSHVLSELAPHTAVPGIIAIDVEVAEDREKAAS